MDKKLLQELREAYDRYYEHIKHSTKEQLEAILNEYEKRTWWNEIDPWLVDALYLHPKFIEFFNERGGKPKDGIYPTVSIRQIMWALKMKPLKRERWETSFDRRLI